MKRRQVGLCSQRAFNMQLCLLTVKVTVPTLALSRTPPHPPTVLLHPSYCIVVQYPGLALPLLLEGTSNVLSQNVF